MYNNDLPHQQEARANRRWASTILLVFLVLTALLLFFQCTRADAANTTYYVNNVGVAGYNGSSSPTSTCLANNSLAGTSPATAWCTMGKVQAFQASLGASDKVLFWHLGTWTEQMLLTNIQGTAGNPIIIGAYGGGDGSRPLISGSGLRAGCFNGDANIGGGGTIKYLTIDGFECTQTTKVGMSITTSSTGASPGITFQNNYIHDTGPGAFTGTLQGPSGAAGSPCTAAPPAATGPCDDSNYNNQLDFQDFGSGLGNDGVRFLNNIVKNCGGHNCVQVHYDGGNAIVRGNIVGPGCLHNCIDVKGSGSTALGTTATIDENIATTGKPTGGVAGGIYVANSKSIGSQTLVTQNVTYNSSVGLQISPDDVCAQGGGHCFQTVNVYNNTFIAAVGDKAYNNSDCEAPTGGCGLNEDTTTTFRNNIMDGGIANVNALVHLTENHNDCGGKTTKGTYTNFACSGTGDVTNSDPLYVDFTNKNFHLTSSSSIKTSGQSGLVGNLTAIGAYNYAQTYYVDSSPVGYFGTSSASGACATADFADGRSTATAWCTGTRLAGALTAGGSSQNAVIGSGDTVNLINGEIWRESISPAVLRGLSGAPVKFQGYNNGSALAPIWSGADCLGTNTGVCNTAGSLNTWTLCADCGAGAGSIYWTNAEPNTVMGVYVDDPANSYGLKRAACLPSESCAAGTPDYTEQAQMTIGSEFYATAAGVNAVKGRLYVWTADGSNPNTHIIEGQVRDTGFLFNGADALFSWITLSGIEFDRYQCHGVGFHDSAAPTGVGMPGIVLTGLSVNENGTGAADHTGFCNSIHFLDDSRGPDSAQITLSTATACGGHSCVLVQGDLGGSTLVQNNNVSKWNSNGIAIADSSAAIVELNTAHDSTNGAAFKGSNLVAQTASFTARKNVAYNVGIGVLCGVGDIATHNMSCFSYNNTIYNATVGNEICGAACAGTVAFTSKDSLLDSTTPITDLGFGTTATLTEDYDDLGATRASPTMSWRGTNYTTLAAWRAATGSNGLTIGSNQPALSTNPSWVSPTTDFRLQFSSSVKASCTDLGIGQGLICGALSVAAGVALPTSGMIMGVPW